VNIFTINSQTLRPVTLIEGIDSLLWKVSFQGESEFQIVTRRVRENKALVPVGSYIGTDADRSLMYVEKHDVRNNYDGQPTLTISGRGAEAYLEARSTVLEKPLEEGNQVLKNVYPIDVLHRIVWSGEKVHTLRYPYRFETRSGFDSKIGGIIPAYEIPRTNVYSALKGFCEAYGFGLKMVRPTYDDTDRTIVFDWKPGRNLVDRKNPTFNGVLGDVEEEQYVQDVRGRFDAVYAFAQRAWQGTYNSSSKGPSDYYTYRIKTVDFQDTEPKDMIKAADVEYAKAISQEGADLQKALVDLHNALNNLESFYYQKDLVKQRSKELHTISQKDKAYSFKISPHANAVYGSDYELGDVVSVLPSFGESVNMRVVSYVRIEEEGNVTEFPELEQYTGTVTL